MALFNAVLAPTGARPGLALEPSASPLRKPDNLPTHRRPGSHRTMGQARRPEAAKELGGRAGPPPAARAA